MIISGNSKVLECNTIFNIPDKLDIKFKKDTIVDYTMHNEHDDIINNARKWGYCTENTTFFQSNEIHNNQWAKDISSFLFNKFSFAVMKLPPGTIIPAHQDKYNFFRTLYNISDDDKHKIVRYIVFLDDWEPGQSTIVEEASITHWKKGECVGWHNDAFHIGINGGKKDKIFLQITGI